MTTPSEHLFILILWLTLGVGFAIPFLVAAGFRLQGCTLNEICDHTPQVGMVIALWWLLVLGVSWSGATELNAGSLNPLLPVLIALPTLSGALWLLRSRRASSILAVVPVAWLVGVQVYRGIGGVFLLLMDQGVLPPEFARPAGYGDVFIGTLALPIALYCVEERPGWRLLAIVWNVLGIADMLAAVALGFLSSPSPIQKLALDHPNVWVSHFPLVMIPAYVVPVSLLLHIAALRLLFLSRHTFSSSN